MNNSDRGTMNDVSAQDKVNLNIDLTDNRKRYEVTCGLHNTVGQLKKLIQDKTNIAPIHQKLKYNDQPLANLRILSYYGIHKYSTVKLNTRYLGGSLVVVEEIHVRVKWVTSEEDFEVTSRPSITVGQLKDKIQDETGIPPNNQKLIHHDETLHDYKKLPDYGIGNGSTVKMYEKNFDGEPREDLSDRAVSQPISY